MTLHIHALLHVDFEDLGFIAEWADSHHHKVTYTRFYDHDSLPETDSFDWLIIMGGPMSIDDESQFPWLADEKRFIEASIQSGKTILGFCLGAQLVADRLGATVQPSGIKEIGWLPISLTEAGARHPLLQALPKEAFTVFHWHGDGFECPKGATPIATSETWTNQGFIYQTPKHTEQGTWIVGWQCHFEVTPESMVGMVAHGMDEIESALDIFPETVQSGETIIALGQLQIRANNQMLATILERLVSVAR